MILLETGQKILPLLLYCLRAKCTPVNITLKNMISALNLFKLDLE